MHFAIAESVVGTPVAEVEITVPLVRALLLAQHPDLAHLPINGVDAGWDNAMFRLGEQLCVRLPRRLVAAPLIEHEQRWLPKLAPQLTLPAPIPYRIGLPSSVYPWCWSVLPWLPGAPADLAEPHAAQALRLAEFLRSLHTPAPPEAPPNRWRGVPLTNRIVEVEERMERLTTKTNLITHELRTVWERALAAPLSNQSCWLHGDLHARNVLVENGAISGIIDWGDMTAGDVATDLAALWMLFADREARDVALLAYGADEATLQRAQGWAVLFGVMLLDSGLVDHPRHAVMGERTLLHAIA